MEMRTVCETRILEIESGAKQEGLKAHVESRRKVSEKILQVRLASLNKYESMSLVRIGRILTHAKKG